MLNLAVFANRSDSRSAKLVSVTSNQCNFQFNNFNKNIKKKKTNVDVRFAVYGVGKVLTTSK